MSYQIHAFFSFNNYFYNPFFFAVLVSDDEWTLLDDLPDLENVVLESDARRVSPADTPSKRLVPSKKRKPSDEGRKDGKGRGKKTRKGLALRHFTFFYSLLAAAVYFCNEIIVKRLSRGHCDNPTDVCNLLSVAGSESINNKEGLCMSIGAMCAFCRNCVEIVNSRMKSNNKLIIRVNFFLCL